MLFSLYALFLLHSFVITGLNSDPPHHGPRARLWKTVSFDYNLNAAAPDRGGGGGSGGGGGVHADMHSIRMIYANYAHYSRRNLSSESARINCRKLAIKFTMQRV